MPDRTPRTATSLGRASCPPLLHILSHMPVSQTKSAAMDLLTSFGFALGRASVHTARTMMLRELTLLLDYVPAGNAGREEYVSAIVEDNCLGKRSQKNRVLTLGHLIDLYTLDGNTLLFRILRHFWQREPGDRALLAALVACARDQLFRQYLPFVLAMGEGEPFSRPALDISIREREPERFSPVTLTTVSQHLAASWVQSGFLEGKLKKHRIGTRPGPGAVSLALLLGYLAGVRGALLFQTFFAKVLDCPADELVNLAEEASRRGYLVCKHVGDVMDIHFNSLLTVREQELIGEQDQTASSELLKLHFPSLA